MSIRIYDIAKKLGIDQKEVLSKAKELGISAARVASSSLDKITAEYLEQELRKAFPNTQVVIPAPEPRAPNPGSKPKDSSLPPAAVACHSAVLPQLASWKFHGLTHDEIVFRVLLQREETRTALTFRDLERSLPKQLLKSIESDWRSYIRDEGIEFDSAFQKAVRKHLPGIYYVVMAAEFLGKTPFHVALLSFLQPDTHEFRFSASNEDEIFELADLLAQEVRLRAAAQTRQIQQPPIHRKLKTTPKPSADLECDQTGLKHKKATQRQSARLVRSRTCAFCRRRFPASAIWEHIDREHINPPHLGVGPVYIPNTSNHSTTAALPPRTTTTRLPTQTVTRTTSADLSRFRRHRCIECGNLPIPGDYYCYNCAPK